MRKMSALVGVAKALYDQFSSTGEDSINGDFFLTSGFTLKADIPELVSGQGRVGVVNKWRLGLRLICILLFNNRLHLLIGINR